ncbi:hypothetical protein LVJ94_32235 [Pendulispora rubella]|uniref:Uncharacterized protein n=1 Tax=Pendulispora rubella TaxID=2741070 RepID=A0ABZ2KVI2_9BACT
MPADDMRMSWHGLTVSQLCESLKDPARNGHRQLPDVIDHLDTGLVKWAWEPGSGRERPPLAYGDFVAKMRAWKEAGAPCGDR